MPARVPETQAYYVCFRQTAEEERKIVGFRSRQPMVSDNLKMKNLMKVDNSDDNEIFSLTTVSNHVVESM